MNLREIGVAQRRLTRREGKFQNEMTPVVARSYVIGEFLIADPVWIDKIGLKHSILTMVGIDDKVDTESQST